MLRTAHRGWCLGVSRSCFEFVPCLDKELEHHLGCEVQQVFSGAECKSGLRHKGLEWHLGCGFQQRLLQCCTVCASFVASCRLHLCVCQSPAVSSTSRHGMNSNNEPCRDVPVSTCRLTTHKNDPLTRHSMPQKRPAPNTTPEHKGA